MSNLINIETKNINGELIQTVNARDLYAFLESKQDFSTWIKKNEFQIMDSLKI
ncbi:antA/AntB antirepressor family protein [Arsenophonus endosymbiont of Aleurodicus floccissimus]|uniref:antA/AntB antirepressor family protein n=1 Tax=Arsenophonus endosymbiont of Aleurodicus floccissimus TaxID=2152761 RepID=UPI001EDFBE3B|nr:antA/AntB antirepressor family protein [Arsenophonus endosymbiont of Aleurodicus floccissimus]